MQAAAKKTGSVLHFEPMRKELINCFGALKDVTPDQVFSNRRGTSVNKPSESGSGDNEEAEGQVSSSNDQNTSATANKPRSKQIE